jgi:hypothetical protein
MDEKLETPETKTPGSVFVILFVLVALTGGLLCWLLGFSWGVIFLLVILAATTGVYTETVPGFDAHILLNRFTQKQRAIFQGVNFKLPWEEVQEEKIDLKTDLKEVLEQTWPSKDTLMKARYVYTIRPDDSGDNAGDKVILYASFEPDAIKMAGRAIFSMLFSDYFRTRPGSNLKNKEKIYNAIFGKGKKGEKLVKEFEEEHGAEVTVRLEDIDFDKATQKFRDMVSGARSFDEAIEVLVKNGKGMTREEALRVAKLMNFEDVSESNINVHVVAPDLTNLHDITVLGGVGLGDKKGGKKK